MARRGAARLCCVLVFLGTSTLMLAGPAEAATINVNTTADQYGTGSECSLREAIQAVNTAAPFGGCPDATAGDVVELPPGIYTLARTGAGEDANATGDLDLLEDMTISGQTSSDTEIVGSGDRVFDMEASMTSRLEDLTIRGGATSPGNGAGIDISAVSLDLTVERVVLGPNTSSDFGGGISVEGYTTNQQAFVTIRDSTISGNTTTYEGGGVAVYNDAVVTIESSLITDNIAFTNGDGVVNYGGNSSLTIRNTTIAGNGFGTVGDLGGGMMIEHGVNVLENVTFADNEGGAASGTGGHLYQTGGLISTHNVLMGTAPISGECVLTNHVSFGTDLVESPGVCGTFTQSATLGLGALGNEGGLTQSVPISAGSDARGVGDVGYCADADQRGVPRPDGVPCDVGAYQFATCFGTPVNRVGTSADDSLTGDALQQNESFLMLSGNDTVLADLGSDKVCGGAGKDRLFGGSGKDALDGGSGDDLCDGGPARDKAKACERERSIP